MNPTQLSSIVRSALKIVGALLAAHGYATTGTFISGEACAGFGIALVGLILSHFNHTNSNESSGGGKVSVLVALAIPAAALFTGCASTDLSNNAFTAEYAAASASDAAMKGYAVYWNDAWPTNFNRTPDGLLAERANVEAASAQVGASIALTENLRASFATNAAVEPQLQAAVAALAQNSSNVVNFVEGILSVTTNLNQ